MGFAVSNSGKTSLQRCCFAVFISWKVRGFTLMGPFPFLYMDRYSADDMMMTFYIERHIFLNRTGDIK